MITISTNWTDTARIEPINKNGYTTIPYKVEFRQSGKIVQDKIALVHYEDKKFPIILESIDVTGTNVLERTTTRWVGSQLLYGQ